MDFLLTYLGVCLGPIAAFHLLERGLKLLETWDGPRRRTADPVTDRIDQLTRDLSRLKWDHQRTSISDQPLTATKLRAIALAYDDTLLACLRELQLPVPPGSPLTSVDRLHTEAVISQHGLVW